VEQLELAGMDVGGFFTSGSWDSTGGRRERGRIAVHVTLSF